MFEIVHIGIPTTQSKEGETYAPGAEIFVTPPEKSPFAIEYVRFLPGTVFPESMHYDVHVAASHRPQNGWRRLLALLRPEGWRHH